MYTRKIKTVLTGRPSVDGAGVHLRRMFGNHDVTTFDPFLMLDDFSNDKPENYIKGFPWHPHRGIETITYLIKGSAEHGDSMGNQGVIEAGEVQWMTAGSGIIHQEMPLPDPEGKMYGFQLWANLPAAQKMRRPRYQNINKEEIPLYTQADGSSVRIISGKYQNLTGPVTDITINPQFFDVNLTALSELELETASGFTCFIYAYAGEGEIAGRRISKNQVVLFEDGDNIAVKAASAGFNFIFLTGKPLREPIAWGGPIVMNTEAELKLAFEELDKGTFIKRDII